MTKAERLEYLIKELAAAQQRSVQIPDEYGEKRRLLRVLMNICPPVQLSPEFWNVQDEFLGFELSEKPITNCEQLPVVVIHPKISLWRGDITTLKADAIVNAANAALLGCFIPCHNCIDNAIHSAAGLKLRMECSGIMQNQGFAEPTGSAKITKAYNLPSRYVIHTVGPIVAGDLTAKDCDLLRSCYTSCLELAENNKLTSIAFCCISTGEFHFPQNEAAEIAIQTVTHFLSAERHIQRVIFNVFTEKDFAIYRKLLGEDR